MTSNAARQANFDAFPADQRQPDPRPAARPGADPLAELARIVGQDDPFRALLEARDGRGAPPPAPVAAPAPAPMMQAPAVQAFEAAAFQAPAFEASLQPTHAAYHEPVAVEAPMLRGALYAHEPAPADAFDRYLAEVETRGPYAADPETALPPPPAAPPRSRRLLVSVGAALGVVTVAVAGGLTWRNMRAHPVSGEAAPIVMADKAPLKVAPQNAGGAEFPGQDKQIYERGTNKDKPTRVVNREEQPVDVAQVARQAAARDAGPGATTSTLQDSLGEPRRVRTVAVRPEAPAARQPEPAATATPSAMPTMTLPTGTGATAQPSTPAARAARPTPVAPVVAEPATTAAATPRNPVAAAAPPAKPQRVASANSEAAVATPVEAASAASSSAFAVQLAVRPSEKEARVAFKEIQGRYSNDLGGRAPIIKQAEVSGKTVYRIRVGASTLDDANGLCNKLKASGGQCFVAKN